MDEAGPGCSFHPAVMLGCLLVLIVAAAAIVLLPWWLNVGLVLGVALAAGLVHALLDAGAARRWRERSEVLRGATLTVHALTPVTDGPMSEGMCWYWLDITIAPAATEQAPAEWDPEWLWLADYDSDCDYGDCRDPFTFGPIEEVLVQRDGQFIDLGRQQVTGEQRLRLRLRLAADVHLPSAWLRYRAERLGSLELPGEPGGQVR